MSHRCPSLTEFGRITIASRFETFIRSRRVRIAVAGSLAATGLWAFAPYVLTEVGGDAYVNAPLVRIASPISGIAGTGIPAAGSYVAVPKKTRLVTALTIDDAASGMLSAQQAALILGLALAERQLRELATADSRLAGRAAGYGRAAGGRLGEWAIAARADTLACTAEAAEIDAQAARVVTLAAKGFAANATVERVRSAAASMRARCKALSAPASASANEAAAARDGVYLGNGTASRLKAASLLSTNVSAAASMDQATAGKAPCLACRRPCNTRIAP